MLGDRSGGTHDEPVLPRDLAHQSVALFALSSGILEDQLEQLLREQIIDADFENTDGIDNLLGEQSFYRKIQLAYDFGLIDAGMKGQIDDVRKARNELVHDTTARLRLESRSTFIDRVNKSASLPEKMQENINKAKK